MRRHVWMAMGLIAGIVLGGAAFWLERNGHPQLAAFTMAIKPIGTLFVNLLSMVVIPLIAAALFAGIAKLGDLRTLGTDARTNARLLLGDGARGDRARLRG